MRILTKGEYYGDQNLEIDFNGILLSKYQYDPARPTDWRYQATPYFMYVLKGNMKDSNTRTTTLCPAGSLMFNNWEEPHFGSKHSKHASGFHLEFERDWLQKKGIDLNLWEGSQRIDHPNMHRIFVQLYKEFLLADAYSDVSIELLLTQVCDTLSDVKKTEKEESPSWVADLKELLHYETASLNLTYLAQTLDVHPVHLSRTAPKYLSTSLGTYFRLQKLKQALPLLLNPAISLTEIAYEVGFSDQSHFNRVFKSYFNCNPREYRKTFKKSSG